MPTIFTASHPLIVGHHVDGCDAMNLLLRLPRFQPYAATVFTVLIVLVSTGSRSNAASCHQAERPEWAAFDFLEVGNSLASLAALDGGWQFQEENRLIPQPCSGNSDHGNSVGSANFETGLQSSLTTLDVIVCGRLSWPSFDEFLPSNAPTRLDRPPRLIAHISFSLS